MTRMKRTLVAELSPSIDHEPEQVKQHTNMA